MLKLFKFLHLIGILAAVSIAYPAQSQNQPTALVDVANRTQATLEFEFQRGGASWDRRTLELAPGEARVVQVPAGLITLSIFAPYSTTHVNVEHTAPMNAGERYTLHITNDVLGVSRLRDDDMPGQSPSSGGGASLANLYNACINAGPNQAVWYIYNPHNTLSRATYYQSGSYLCHEDGDAAYIMGSVMRHYECTPSFRDCLRDEGWDARLGPDIERSTGTWDGRSRPTEMGDIQWETSTSADWAVTIYR